MIYLSFKIKKNLFLVSKNKNIKTKRNLFSLNTSLEIFSTNLFFGNIGKSIRNIIINNIF